MKVETYKIRDWEEPETGLLIDENEEWVLVKHIPVDYVIDGYKLFKKEFLEERDRGDAEKLIEKVLTLKKMKTDLPIGFKYADTEELLKWTEDKYGVFEFQDNEGDELFYGKVNQTDGANLIIDMIKSDGSVEEEFDYEFQIDEIRAITFESDYHKSICLLWKDQLNKK
ncbi:MAG: hypothetical protein GY756_03335 [bacterium]|nr:hypothetical protein [bacterium]